MDCNVRPESMERITTKALADAFIEEQIKAVREQVGNKKVLLALARQNKPLRYKSLSTQLPLFSLSSLLQSVASSVGMSISKVFALKTM